MAVLRTDMPRVGHQILIQLRLPGSTPTASTRPDPLVLAEGRRPHAARLSIRRSRLRGHTWRSAGSCPAGCRNLRTTHSRRDRHSRPVTRSAHGLPVRSTRTRRTIGQSASPLTPSARPVEDRRVQPWRQSPPSPQWDLARWRTPRQYLTSNALSCRIANSHSRRSGVGSSASRARPTLPRGACSRDRADRPTLPMRGYSNFLAGCAGRRAAPRCTRRDAATVAAVVSPRPRAPRRAAGRRPAARPVRPRPPRACRGTSGRRPGRCRARRSPR